MNWILNTIWFVSVALGYYFGYSRGYTRGFNTMLRITVIKALKDAEDKLDEQV